MHQDRVAPSAIIIINTAHIRIILITRGLFLLKRAKHHRSTRNIPREARTFSRSEQYQRQNCKMNHHNIFHNLLLYAVHIISQNPPGYTKCQHELNAQLQFTSISITSNHALKSNSNLCLKNINLNRVTTNIKRHS